MTTNSHGIRLKVVLGAVFVLLFLAIVSPFLIKSGWGFMSENFIQGLFSVFIFLITINLWRDFNKLRLKLNEKELKDKNLTELQHNVKKMSQENDKN